MKDSIAQIAGLSKFGSESFPPYGLSVVRFSFMEQVP